MQPGWHSRSPVDRGAPLSSKSNRHNDHNSQLGDIHGGAIHNDKQNRRSFLERGALSLSLGAFGSPAIASARGLIRFPCKQPLLNTYHFMRAGTSLLEVEDIWSTNPLFLTNREAALSEIGVEQVREACRFLKSTGSAPTVVRYSLAAAAIDSANIVGEELNIGRDRLVPEFNYMDPRAIGMWDMAALNATEEAVWALDADEAGTYGKGGRPPPNEDGTPAETLSDQAVRLTNLMSVLETLYSGDVVLLVFPDGTGPALLSCLMGGINLNRVHELSFRPGELRVDVDYNSINAIASQPPSSSYMDILQRGRSELKQLRDNPDILRNKKDLKYEEEREQERIEQEAKREEEAKAKELERQRKREERIQMKNNTSSNNSLGASSLGIAGAVLGGAAFALSVFQSDDEADEIVLGGDNVTDTDKDEESSLNSTVLSSDEDTEEIDLTTLPNLTPEWMLEEDNNVPPPIQLSDIDYDEAWLGTISDIINDSDDEDTSSPALDATLDINEKDNI